MEQEVQHDQGNPAEEKNSRSKKAKNEIVEWLKAIVIALVLVILIRWLLFETVCCGRSVPCSRTLKRVNV